MSTLRRFAVFFSVAGLSVLVDQLTKVIAIEALKGAPMRSYLGDVFRFVYATNDGAFLSLGSQLPPMARFWVLTVGVGGLLFALMVHALRSPALKAWPVAGYALIVSGGFSNWVDRARFGGLVVDFMNLGIGQTVRTGIFNVADLAILAGIGVLFFTGAPETKKDEPAAAPPPEASAPQAPTSPVAPSAPSAETDPSSPPSGS